MALLSVSQLSKSFDNVKAVDEVSLTADRGEILCLLGPSGCGKTTLLRVIAGLEEPEEGTITFEGRPLDGVPAQQRGVGLMFQDLALFPHMDVFGNVAFGLRMQRLPRDRIRERVRELLALVEMTDYAQREVHELSGGERQRVALARSLAPAPQAVDARRTPGGSGQGFEGLPTNPDTLDPKGGGGHRYLRDPRPRRGFRRGR